MGSEGIFVLMRWKPTQIGHPPRCTCVQVGNDFTVSWGPELSNFLPLLASSSTVLGYIQIEHDER